MRPIDILRAMPKGLRRSGVLALVTLVGSAGLAIQFDRVKAPPGFGRGGTFGNEQAARIVPTFNPTNDATPDGSGTPEATGSDGEQGSNRVSRGTITSPTTPAPTQPPPQAPADPRFPTVGTYTYSNTGTEGATGFGSRQFEDELTLDAKRSGGVGPDEIVFDINLYPSQGSGSPHTEREIVAYRDDGIYFTYEGGKVVFGPGAQTDQANYKPAMLQIRKPLTVTKQAAPPTECPSSLSSDAPDGTSEAHQVDDQGRETGNVTRTEDWWVDVIGQETLQILGGPVETWVVRVERKTRPGSNDQLQRCRTYWYDPGRRIWVKWHEKMHGERDFGVSTFTYDNDYTATLTKAP